MLQVSFDAEDYTEKTWEKKFEELRSQIKVRRTTLLKPKEKEKEDKILTSYAWYCQYVNDAIKEIRAGRTYYAYSIDHVKELLKYFGKYLHADLHDFYWTCYVTTEGLEQMRKENKILAVSRK